MCECPASAAQDLAGKQGSRRRTFVACRFGRRLCCRCLFGRPPCCRFGRPLCCRCRRDLCCRCRRRCRCRWVVDGGGRARALWGVVLSLGVCALALRGFALTVALGAALLGALAFALLASCLGSFPPLASPLAVPRDRCRRRGGNGQVNLKDLRPCRCLMGGGRRHVRRFHQGIFEAPGLVGGELATWAWKVAPRHSLRLQVCRQAILMERMAAGHGGRQLFAVALRQRLLADGALCRDRPGPLSEFPLHCGAARRQRRLACATRCSGATTATKKTTE